MNRVHFCIPRLTTQPSAPDTPRATAHKGILLALVLLICIPGTTLINVDSANAREVSIHEEAYLRLVAGGDSADGRGSAKGTFACQLSAGINLQPPRQATGTFTLGCKHGSIAGHASAEFVSKNAKVYFGGLLQITRGTGRYRHASGKNLGVSGIINREALTLTVHVNGMMHL
jgi:hypothetical protein